jgi:guanylate cyclase soluble subunit beta
VTPFFNQHQHQLNMYGAFFLILEDFFIERNGLTVWHSIKKIADCTIHDRAYLRRQHYPDEDFVQLVVSASELLGESIEDVLQAFGSHTIVHHYDNGNSNLLRSMGGTLREWLTNLNAMHDYLQKTFSGEHFHVSYDQQNPLELSV